MKTAISSKLALKLLDFKVLFEVHTDSFDKAVGGMLVQEGHLVVFESWKLKDAELKYSTQEKKMLVVIHCLQVW